MQTAESDFITAPGTLTDLPPPAPRLNLRPAQPGGTFRPPLDGAWWPRSADPVAELPGLVLALRTHGLPDDRLPVAHIMMRSGDWDGHPRRLRVDGPDDTRMVQLSWFRSLPAGFLTAIYADGRRVNLLTVPPSADPAAAEVALELAADRANRLPASDLLAALTVPTDPHDPGWAVSVAQNSWESEAGRLHEHPVAH